MKMKLPPRSSFMTFSRKVPCRGGALIFRKKKSRMSAIMPTGRLSRNTQRHEVDWTMTPPRKGPRPVPTEMAEKMIAINLPRSRSGTKSQMIKLTNMLIPPPPTPWTTRPKIITVMLGVPPQMPLPTTNANSGEENQGTSTKHVG